MEKVLALMLLGKRRRFFKLLKIKGILYKIDIRPYETVDEMMKKAINSGAFMA